MSTPAVTLPAESAPASETPEVSVQERLDHATSGELDTWRKTGDIPAVKIKTPEAELKIEAKPDVPPPSKSEPAAASPAAPPQKPESRSDRRYREITQENRDLRERLDAIERKTSQPAEEKRGTKPESQTAAEVKTSATDKEPELGDVNPKTGKPFATIAEWQKEHTAWLRAQILGEVKGEFTKANQQSQQEREQQRRDEDIATKLLSGKEKYPDFDKVAFGPDLLIPRTSPADEFIRASDHAADLLYYLGQHPEVLKGFYRYVPGKDDVAARDGQPGRLTGVFDQLVTPFQQIATLARIEAGLNAAPAPKKEQALPPANPAPPKLPPPAPELGGRHATVGDDAEKALARGDFATWKRLTDKKELAAAKR
jgi:hypothetical protein